MAASVDDDGAQRLSLVGHPIEDDGHAEQIEATPSSSSSFQSPSGRRSAFWSSLFRKRSAGDGDDQEEDMEDSALLDSCPDLANDSRRGDDEELDDYRDDGGDPSHRTKLLSGSSGINESDEDDEEEDSDDENDWDENDNGGGSMGHQLLSTGDDDADLINMHSSEPVLRYNHKNVEHHSESGDEDEEEEEEEEEEPEHLPPLRNFFRRTQSMNSSAYSDNNYSDERSMVDSENRKNINERIQGFGSEPSPNTTESPERFAAARNLGQRLRDFTSAYRMRKMDIGEDTIQRQTWVERFDNAVDRVLPPDPELEGYVDAFQVRGKAAVPIPHDQERKSRREPPVINIRVPQSGLDGIVSHRRKELGNIDDPSYIIFLECELQNKELELNSWKRRAAELEAQVKRLNGEEAEDDGESTGSDASNTSKADEADSEIEWQTGVPDEGTLIDVDGVEPKSAVVHQSQQGASEDEEAKQSSTYMMMHAPDGPNGDEKYAIIRRSPPGRNKKDVQQNDDDLFPVLSSESKRKESEASWMETSLSAKTPVTITPRNDASTFDAGDAGLVNDSKSGMCDDDDDDDDDKSEESSTEEGSEDAGIQPPTEGVLIELDDTSPKDTKTDTTLEIAAIVSDDDVSVHDNVREGILLDLESSQQPSNDSSGVPDGTSASEQNGDSLLIQIES